MLGTRRLAAWVVLATAVGEPPARGQGTAPAILGLFPPGATAGAATEWTLTGRNLDKVERWLVSGAGVEVIKTAVKDASTLAVTVKVDEDAEPGIRELRVLGEGGLSNLALFRVDRLAQAVEAEPNDVADKATPIAVGTAAAGVLTPQDIDAYRLDGRKGQKVVVEVEAQRLGTALSPVVTVLSATGTALAQGRETPGVDRDCRLPFTFPADESYLVQVRDNAFQGAERAAYRLRVAESPFATGLYPLGGPRGQTIVVTASGGNLEAPRTRSVTLPDRPGEVVEVGPFDGPGGPAPAPMRLVVGDGPEVEEAEGAKTVLGVGTVANGRIGAPGEIDHYEVAVKKGQKLHVRIQAAALGSWLDSVVTIRDARGDVVAENDDPPTANQRRGPFNLGAADAAPDSRLDVEVKDDATWTIEVVDRYGDGGPEYAYRLDVAEARPDFSISLLFGPNVGRVNAAAQRRNVPLPPGASGSFNLRPSTRQLINFLITPDGVDGEIEVRAEGLPPGVRADPVTVRFVGAGRNQPAGGALVLQVEPDAESGVGDLRVVAALKPPKGGATVSPPVIRTASAVVTFAPLVQAQGPFGPARATTHPLAMLPVAVLGRPKMVGPPRPLILALKSVAVPGPLLQGSKIELPVTLEPPNPGLESFDLEADVKGRDILAQTIIPDPDSYTGDEEGEDAPTGPIVRLVASAKAKPGPRTVTVTFTPRDGSPVEKAVTVDVVPPIALRVPQEPIRLEPGAATSLHVGLKRAAGFDGPVELKMTGLPRGVKVVGAGRIDREKEGVDLTLRMDPGAAPLAKAVAFRVTGTVRMPRGLVQVDSAIRPMVLGRSAEK